MRCHNCKNTAAPGRANCYDCLDKAKKQAKEKRIKFISAGLCSRCGKQPPTDGKNKCQSCFDKDRTRDKKFVTTCKINKECPRCKRSFSFVLVWTNSYCAHCHLKYKFKWVGCKEEAEKIINDLLIKQNFRCALSGRDLRNSKYHIDHILPRATHPERVPDPANWQLVVEEVNMLKGTLSAEEIFRLAEDIVNYRNKKVSNE